MMLWNLRGPYQWGLSGAPGPSVTFASQKIISCVLITEHDRLGDGDKFHMKILDFESLVFMPPVTQNLKLNDFSRKL